jgi:hypothetical protein
MASIYEQAYLTIAASSSTSCDKSFLDERGKSSVAVTYFENTGGSTIVKARKVPTTGMHRHETEQGTDPWEVRAWTLQEKLLSTRLISYSAEEIQWACKSLKTCESKQDIARPFPEFSSSIFQLCDNFDAHIFWQTQVMAYTSRRLTCPDDKLPALSGVASRIHQVTGSEYFAGLWVANFMHDLCWERVGGGESDDPPFVLPPSYRAPSFPWASVEGAIFYSDQNRPSDFISHAIVVEKTIKLPGEICFGQVEHASITVCGPVLPASVSRMTDERELLEYSLFLELDEKEYEFTADVRLEEHTFDMHVESPVRFLRRSATEANHLVERAPVWILSLGNSFQ